MKAKTLLSLLLASTMLLPSLVACSESNVEETKATANTPVAGATETTPAETNYFDDVLPTADYSGKTYAILHQPANGSHDTLPDFEHEDMTGEPVDDAIYNQILTVEEKYGCDITENLQADVLGAISQGAQASDTSFQIALYGNGGMANLVTQNLLLDLNELEYLDMSQPWWNQNYREKLTIAGKTFLGFGDLFFVPAINNVHLMYFNKDMCDDLQIEYPYQAVLDGKFTLDYLKSIMANTLRDLDGNGIYDAKDQYGLVQSPIQSSIIFYTAGFKVMSYDEEGYPYLDMYSQAFVDFYEALYNFDYNTPGVWTNSQAEEDPNFQMFVDDRVLISSHFLTVTPTLREVEFEVGILPYPKYTEDSEYINWPTGGNFLMGVPSVTPFDDYDFVGIITEALAVKGHELVRPAQYEQTLQGKLARDPESVQMLDLIFDTMSIDFGWIHSGDQGLGWFVNSCLTSKLQSISSYFKRVEARAAKYYEGVVDFYRELD